MLLILHFGCEGSCLTEALLQRHERLRIFHSQCLRAMPRVSDGTRTPIRVATIKTQASTKAGKAKQGTGKKCEAKR